MFKKLICKKLYFFKKTFTTFKLNEDFINLYKNKDVNFGFNGLGNLVYRRTYSRMKDDGTNEEWFETVRRVVEGTFNLLITHCDENSIKLENQFININEDSMKMYDKIFNFKFLPPGRGLWSMGTNITNTKKIFAALNNCAFVSTKPRIKDNLDDIVKPYLFLMDSGMLGVGVGFDTKASECNIMIKNVNKNIGTYLIEDSREGWVKSVEVLMKSYFSGSDLPQFDYSKIREAGEPLKIFGGVSAGFKPLKELHDSLIYILDSNVGKAVNSRIVVDIMNLIGRSVVSGNIRRTAEIAIGDANDTSFIELKNYEKNPDRMNYGWVSNNSIYANLGMDYSSIVENIVNNGEPGLLWLDNMRKYSRMVDLPDYKDLNVSGGNPCLEQSLESYEMCCLSETFPFHHNSLEEYLDTLKYSFMYAKIVTLGMTHWNETNSIMSKNRRIGVSMTGIAQFINKHGLEKLKIWAESGYIYIKNYDKVLSTNFKVPESIKITSIKPSGTVSLLGGATPGIHYPHSRFYIRRVRLSNRSNLIDQLLKNGYHIEPDVMQSDTTLVVSFPIDIGKGVKTLDEVSIWEQMSLAAFMQRYWADNQVSCTVTFKKSEAKEVKNTLDYFQYQLKGISFLPLSDDKNPYPQMPYEEISEEIYKGMMMKISNTNLSKNVKQEYMEKYDSNFCDSDTCNINI